MSIVHRSLAAISLVAWASAASADPAWDALVAAAQKEGEVDVHGGPGKLYEEALTQGFARDFPAIKINYFGASGRDTIPKIMREREAGIYSWDVYVGGTTSTVETLKPAGAFQPLLPALVLPEVLDDTLWLDGLGGEWMDKERKFVLGFEVSVTPTMVVNWDFVARGDLKSYDDLLKPPLAGKIVWDDPRRPGQGVDVAQRFLLNFGEGFLERLFAQQKIVYSGNTRQTAEWVVRGTYPIGIGTGFEQVKPFQDQGLGKSIAAFDVPLARPGRGAGYGTVALMDHAPHPNAAKVYINWLLSKAGQTEWTRTTENSRRLDVPRPSPETFPQPGVAYIDDQAEENLASRKEAASLAQKFIPASP
ncbi:MAG TPA: extracellular solute-binding protein [Stellaceae bacterium]|nr:extracellular solute-binding protein [Stellaceae bacterium]